MPTVSYRTAFIALFAALLVVTTLAVGVNAYRRASLISLGLSTDIIDGMSQTVAVRTVALLEEAYSYLETNALVVPAAGLAADREAVFRLFWRQLELSPQILSIFAADASGGLIQVRAQPQPVTRFIDRSGARPRERLIYRDRGYAPIAHVEGGGLFDPRETAWYVGALAAQGNVTWSAVYRFADVQKPGITAAKTIYGADGKPALVLGVDIALEGISELLANQLLAKGGVAAIVDDRGFLIAYPYHLKLRPRDPNAPQDALPSVDELADPALIAAYRTLESARDRGPGAYRGTLGRWQENILPALGGERWIARLHPFPSHWTEGWALFVAVPRASLLTTASRLLAESAVISAIILAVSVFLLSWLALKLFRPLARLERNTELIRELRFSEVQSVKSRFREIQAMDAAICGMKQGLQTLEKYVPASVARGLIESGETARPGVDVAHLTLFCGGLEEIGRLCRALPPETIGELVAGQMDLFTRILVRQRATVDDYLGESLLAFWGAPAPSEDGPGRACLAALQCLEAEAEQAREAPDFTTGLARNCFAVHSGQCLVGNIGSQGYLAYTAIGDHVELVWRLKQMNRSYGTRAIVSAPVKAELAERFWWRRLDLVPVHDGAEPLEIFELQGERGVPLAVEDQLFARAYERALESLLAGDWERAETAFAALAAERPDDRSVQLMRRRCAAHRALPCALTDEMEPAAAPPALSS